MPRTRLPWNRKNGRLDDVASCEDAAGVVRARSIEEYGALRRFPGLDGLRGLAALMVVVYHCPPIDLPMLGAIQHVGDLGVDIFFVLSGFLISALLLREPEDAPHRRLGRFMMKRVLRIFPLYFAAVGLYWAKSHMLGNASVGEAFDAFLPWLLVFCADVHLGGGVELFPNFGIAWSLGVEEKFYLLWPLVAVFGGRRWMFRVAALGIAASCVWRWHLAGTYAGGLTARLYYSFDTRMDGILWGCVLACALHARVGYTVCARVLSHRWAAACALLAFGVVGVFGSNGEPWRYVVMPILATIVVGGFMVGSSVWLARLFDSRVPAHIGTVSFGVYVLHPLVISVIMRVTGVESVAQSVGCVLLSMIVTIAAATVSYAVFERRFLQLKRRFQGPGVVHEADDAEARSAALDGGGGKALPAP